MVSSVIVGTQTLRQEASQNDPITGVTWRSYLQNNTRLTNQLLSGKGLPRYIVANLQSGAEGDIAYALNGRKVGEGAGAGTGVPVYWSSGNWRVYSTDAAVTA